MKYAIAILNIKPAEFWDLTLAEFNVAMEAYEWKVYQERVRNAEHALWTLLPHVKEIPSIKDLVGLAPGEKEEQEKEKAKQSKEDYYSLKEEMSRMGK